MKNNSESGNNRSQREQMREAALERKKQKAAARLVRMQDRLAHQSALEQLLPQYEPIVRSYFALHVKQYVRREIEETVKDLVQQWRIKFWWSVDPKACEGEKVGYSKRTAKSVWVDFLRKLQAMPHMVRISDGALDDDDFDAAPGVQLEAPPSSDPERAAQIREALDNLPEEEKEIAEQKLERRTHKEVDPEKKRSPAKHSQLWSRVQKKLKGTI